MDVVCKEKRGRPAKKSRIEPIKKRWLSGKELQDYTGWNQKFIQRLRDSAMISFSRVGSKTFNYDIQSIDRFIEKNRVV